jgi:hypothetical protein
LIGNVKPDRPCNGFNIRFVVGSDHSKWNFTNSLIGAVISKIECAFVFSKKI